MWATLPGTCLTALQHSGQTAGITDRRRETERTGGDVPDERAQGDHGMPLSALHLVSGAKANAVNFMDRRNHGDTSGLGVICGYDATSEAFMVRTYVLCLSCDQEWNS